MSGRAKSPRAIERSRIMSLLAKRDRRRVCIDCGAETRYSGNSAPPGGVSPRCGPCARAARVVWSNETSIEAIRAFAAAHGRPPFSTEWKKAVPGVHPATSHVQYAFGTWAAAIVAAGFPQPRIGKYQRTDETRRRSSQSQLKQWARKRAKKAA